MFIYNVNKSTTENDIDTHVYSKTEIKVLPQKIRMKVDRGYDAYKILVPKNKLNVFLSEDFWPEGVLFRRYMNFSRPPLRNCRSPDINFNG